MKTLIALTSDAVTSLYAIIPPTKEEEEQKAAEVREHECLWKARTW